MYLFKTIITIAILFLGCRPINPDKDSNKTGSVVSDAKPDLAIPDQTNSFFKKIYFSKSDAEKILGEPAFLSDSSSTVKKDTLERKLTYTATSKDAKTGKTGVIYFIIEQYARDTSAVSAYHFFKSANEINEGVKPVDDMGDEAYFHSDGTNFYFILVRKGNIMFRIKVNKLTSHTSLDEFNRVSKKISDDL